MRKIIVINRLYVGERKNPAYVGTFSAKKRLLLFIYSTIIVFSSTEIENPALKTPRLYTHTLWALICLCTFSANAQFPSIQWAKKFGGPATDIPFTIKLTTDGGTIAAGYTDAGNDYWDLHIAKLSKCGDLLWQKQYGGSGYESARDIIQTADGGYIVLGETNSTDGDVINGYGGTKDIWLIKLDANGDLQWQKRYGGSGLDIGNNIIAMPDGNYLIAASTSSNDGNISGNHGTGGYTDGALLKIDPQGNLLWSKCYGGSKNDELLDIEIINNKIYVAGYANSVDGDIPANQKNYDVWLLCTDVNGNKMYSKIYGGSQNDVAYSMCQGRDGSLTLAGYTTSNDGDVSGAKGGQDFWILNVNTAGALVWQHAAGGTEAEYANSITPDNDGGYLAAGISYSEDGDITNAKGEGDYWVVKINAAGQIQWKENYGGEETDHLRTILFNPALNEIYLSGDAASFDGDFSGNAQEADFGIIKLKLPYYDTVDCTAQGAHPLPDTLRDICGYDSAIVICRPPSPEDKYEFQQVRIPNAFTPNGDGKNDEFGAAGKYVTDYFMQVFNRYGELVFQSNAIQKRWNGIYRGKPQPSGTFVYFIRYTDNNKQIQTRKGVFTLIR